MIRYVKATLNEAEQVYNLVQETIKTVYVNYYPQEVVDFFCNLHSKENIISDIENGCVSVLYSSDEIVGTGSVKDNHITRVFVLPQHQGEGYGRFIMQCIESVLMKSYDTAIIDSSLPACSFYEKNGYKTFKHEKIACENNKVLVYEVMEKQLPKTMGCSCCTGCSDCSNCSQCDKKEN